MVVTVESHPVDAVTVSVKTVVVVTVAVVNNAVVSVMGTGGEELQSYVVPGFVSLPVPSRVTPVATPLQMRLGTTEATASGLRTVLAETDALAEHPVTGSVTVSVNTSLVQMNDDVTNDVGEPMGFPPPLDH